MPWRVFRYVIKVGAQERGTIVNSEVSIYWPELLYLDCALKHLRSTAMLIMIDDSCNVETNSRRGTDQKRPSRANSLIYSCVDAGTRG